MRTTFQFVFLFSIFFFHAQERVLKDSDFLLINKDNADADVSSTAEDFLNFHFPIKTENNLYNSKEKDYNDISFFVVTKSKSGNEKSFLEIPSKGIKLTSNELVGINSFKITMDSKPSIVTYIESVPQGKKLMPEDVSFKFNDKQLYYEALSFDHGISNKKREVYESYLAMKYGITLSSNYFNSKNDTIWYYNKNENFRSNILCVGRDDKTGLNQKQSTDYDNSFSFGLENLEKTNYKNKAESKNGIFFFISDNGKIQTSKGKEISKTERIWKVNSEQGETYENSFTFKFDFSKILESAELEKNQTIWWVIANGSQNEIDYTSAKYLKADNVGIKNAVFFKKDISKYGRNFLFSIVKAPEFFAITDPVPLDCYTVNLKVKPVGGSGGYNIQLVNNDSGYIFTKDTDDMVIFENLPAGKYDLKVKDKTGRIFSDTVVINEKSSNNIKQSYDFIISNGESLTLNADNYLPADIKEYSWESTQNKIIEYSKTIKLDKDGEYLLNYVNSSGCKNKITFKVTTDKKDVLNNSKIVIYPNPVKAQSQFTVAIDLAKKSNISIKIYSSAGQLVFEKQYENQDSLSFRHSLLVAGAYYVVVETEKESKTFKVLVQ